jgi:hypothetical protein
VWASAAASSEARRTEAPSAPEVVLGAGPSGSFGSSGAVRFLRLERGRRLLDLDNRPGRDRGGQRQHAAVLDREG